jgi:hypothetical protein
MLINEIFIPKTHSWKLLEAAEGKNTHLEHIEDLIFNEGYKGAIRAFDYLDAVKGLLEGGDPEGKVTVKWDGAPAIVCGVDPEDSKFFVGTKSVFNTTTPKAAKSVAQIKEWYAEQPTLANKLILALQLLPKLGIGTVVQGDFLFGQGDVETDTVGDDECYTFTPNTITYAVPVNSAIGKRVAKAKIGIVFHTEYTGATLGEMTASFGYSVRGLKETSDVWYDDANYKDVSGIATLTASEEKGIDDTIATGRTTLKKVGTQMDAVLQAEFAKFIKPFINNNVRAGEQVGEPMKFLENFMNYYTDKMNKEIEKLKGGAESPAAQKRIEKIEQQKKFLADNSNTLLLTLAVYRRIISAKLMLIKKLSNVDKIGTFVKTDTGYKVTNHEGFVAFGVDGGAVKLNDRMEFNALNFAATKTWSK